MLVINNSTLHCTVTFLFVGSEADSEDEDILIEKKQESEEDSEITVRKRITKTGDNDS